MKCNINILSRLTWGLVWLGLLQAPACRSSETGSKSVGSTATGSTATRSPEGIASQPALATGRIVIVGASVSAGFGGAPFVDIIRAAAPRSVVEGAANVFMFRDPVAETRIQVDKAIGFRATTVIAIDFLFWNIYGSPDPAWRERALTSALAELERLRATGAWLVLGEIPHVVTAAEWMLPRAQVPEAADLATFNATIARWAEGRERVLLVPFASWAAPLAAGAEVEITPGERVAARTLVGPDGLHANALGVWFLLDKLDHWIEGKLPGTPKDARVFKRPPS